MVNCILFCWKSKVFLLCVHISSQMLCICYIHIQCYKVMFIFTQMGLLGAWVADEELCSLRCSFGRDWDALQPRDQWAYTLLDVSWYIMLLAKIHSCHMVLKKFVFYSQFLVNVCTTFFFELRSTCAWQRPFLNTYCVLMIFVYGGW